MTGYLYPHASRGAIQNSYSDANAFPLLPTFISGFSSPAGDEIPSRGPTREQRDFVPVCKRRAGANRSIEAIAAQTC